MEEIRFALSKEGEFYWTGRRSVDGITTEKIYEFEGERRQNSTISMCMYSYLRVLFSLLFDLPNGGEIYW